MRRGFTLIEILLAASMAAVIALAVGQILVVANRAQKRVRARGEARALIGALERRLEADLRAILPPGGVNAAGIVGESSPGAMNDDELVSQEARNAALDSVSGDVEPPPVEDFDRLTLSVFPAALSFGDELPEAEGALWQVVYEIDTDSETEARGLIRTVTRNRNPTPGFEAPEPFTLIEHVVGMKLGFFDGTDWQETWDSGSTDDLPRIIRLHLAIVIEDQVRSHYILVSPPTARIGQPLELEGGEQQGQGQGGQGGQGGGQAGAGGGGR